MDSLSIHYRKKGSGGDFTEESIGHPANNMYTVHQLSPNTQYEFKMQASNQRGKSEGSAEAQVNTPGNLKTFLKCDPSNQSMT